MYSPNFLITNFCNQNCSYCFAKSLMKDKSVTKEMSLAHFKRMVKKAKKVDTLSTLKIFGGEPTLHSKFKEIIKYAFGYFSNIHIFTNGMFSDSLGEFMEGFFPKITFSFNVCTPGFQTNRKIREMISKRIINFGNLTSLSLSITINPQFDISSFMKITDKRIFQKATLIRLGASNPIVREKNLYEIDQFPLMGSVVYKLIEKLSLINPMLDFYLDCGFTKCMFDRKQRKFLKKKIAKNLGFGCYFGNVDILGDNSAIPCYSLSTMYKLSLKHRNISNVSDQFAMKQYIYGKKFMWDKCKKCSFYGFSTDKCSGPCLAFLINRKVPAIL